MSTTIFKNSDKQKEKLPIDHNLTIAEVTNINILTYTAWQCTCLNRSFMVHSIFSLVTLKLTSVLRRTQQLLDIFLLNK